MEYEPKEFRSASTTPPASNPRPCFTPHSAPVAWLRGEPAASPANAGTTDPSDAFEANLDFYAGDVPARRDGWTPFARKLLLQVVAETGIVTRACEYAGLSKQSAFALRARDPLFAAGWDAAALLARNPLADHLYEQGRDGITETVTRNGEIVAERHRYDTRLSIAVLHRLDKRCDRAEEQGSAHLAIMRRWEEWLELIGKGEEQAARDLVESPPHGQFGQLPESANPTEIPNPPGLDPSDNVWRNDDGVWMTTFPPPPGFDGHENRAWDGFSWYERACTAEETELLDANVAAAEAEERAEITAEAEAWRDTWFATLRDDLVLPLPGREGQGMDASESEPRPPDALNQGPG